MLLELRPVPARFAEDDDAEEEDDLAELELELLLDFELGEDDDDLFDACADAL
jgi:hypothetical protein